MEGSGLSVAFECHQLATIGPLVAAGLEVSAGSSSTSALQDASWTAPVPIMHQIPASLLSRGNSERQALEPSQRIIEPPHRLPRDLESADSSCESLEHHFSLEPG